MWCFSGGVPAHKAIILCKPHLFHCPKIIYNGKYYLFFRNDFDFFKYNPYLACTFMCGNECLNTDKK